MRRREFSWALAGSTFVAPALWPATALAQGEFQAGREYIALNTQAPVEAPAGQVEVVEFFSYNCPHCSQFEPVFTNWAKQLPKNVHARRVPVAFIGDFESKQRLYYTLEAMGKLDEFHPKAFDAIHKQRLRIVGDAAIIDWAAKQGLERARFTNLFKSFSVATKVQRATQLQDAYKIEGVPTLGVAGRYYTDLTMAGGVERALQVVKYLIEQSRKTRS